MKARRKLASLISGAVLAAAFVGAGGAAGAEPLPHGSNVAGKIGSDEAGPGFFTAGQKVDLIIDAAAVAKGDILDIFELSGGDGRRGGRIGSLAIISRSGEPPRGMILRMDRELENPARVRFALPMNVQLSRYLPFIRRVADVYVDSPGLRPVNVAFLGVMDEYGRRPEWAKAVSKSVARDICARPQFRCADANAVSELLWELGAGDIRTIPKAVANALRAALGVDIYVSGHARRDGNGVEVLLRAKPAGPSATPGGFWMRRRFASGQFAIPSGSAAAAQSATLRIRLTPPESIEGMRAEYVFHEAHERGRGAATAAVSGRFVEIDGRRFRPGADGTLFDGAVSTGRHRITAGFYSWERNGTNHNPTGQRSAALFARSLEITIAEGEKVGVDVALTDTGEFRLIAADTYTLE